MIQGIEISTIFQKCLTSNNAPSIVPSNLYKTGDVILTSISSIADKYVDTIHRFIQSAERYCEVNSKTQVDMVKYPQQDSAVV